ncbi:hypothetical protein VTO73DRAFT_10405 [Trametes versicolor]
MVCRTAFVNTIGPEGRARGVRGAPSAIPNNPSLLARQGSRLLYFWSTGACARGFECSFRHVKQAIAPGPADQSTPDASQPSEQPEVDFFSTEGLTAGIGSAPEGRHTLNPSEVHNHLRDFIRDKHHLENPGQIMGFVRILASVNDSNKTWNTANAQEFLEFVVKGDALHRIGEILRFEPVKTSIGFGTGALSFQSGYFPLFQFFASDLVLKSTLHKNINHLYSIIKNNHESIFATLETCLDEMMTAQSWMDRTPNLLPSLQNNLDGLKIFRTLSVVLLQYFNRYKDAIRNHSADVAQFIQDFADWFDIWAEEVSDPEPRFADSIAHAIPKIRELGISHVREDIQRLQEIVQRESGIVQRLRSGPPKSSLTQQQRSQALAGQLAQTYDPPGNLRLDGRRHDNDFTNIADIRVAPTHEELFSPVQPYLPVFRHDAPHHLPMNSMERHLDIQFRLLREDLISTTRASMAAIQDDLLTIWQRRPNMKRAQKTKLEEVLEKKGGAYRTSGYDSVFFQIYTNVEFLEQPPIAQRRGVCVTLVLDSPAVGSAREKDAKKRYDFWEHSKRLQGSSLVALVVVSDRAIRAYLGVVSSFGKDIAESSKHAKDRIQLQVAFFDADVELKALQGERLCKNASSYAFLVDNSVMFESVRPFLERIKTIEPTAIPFARYIAPAESIKEVAVMPPKYARVPAFRFKLQCLAQKGKIINDLDILNPAAVARARQQLKTSSVLDPSQADAVVDTLTKEVSLIQGPPGTGKSYTAKEILRVLFTSKIRPIVLIAFTNHALDHMLTSVLDAGITNKVVRLGTRSSDERIMQYTLDKLEKVASASNLDRSFKRQYAVMKKLEEQMTNVMTAIRLPLLDWDKIEQYLDIHYPDHANAFRMPPFWIVALSGLMWAEEGELGEWQDVKKKSTKKKETVESSVRNTLYGFWRAGRDIQYLQVQPPTEAPPTQKGKGKSKDVGVSPQDESEQMPLLANPIAFFESLGFVGMMPPIPVLDRPLGDLLEHSSVWAMSLTERTRLAGDWEQRIRMNAYASQLDHYNSIRDDYKEACKNYDDLRDENRRRLLSQNDLIACTTTGAASLTSLLESVGPQVLLVEEAGQVLEAHILTSLVPSVRHLICIGDPQQLRPTLATFALSMDSERGNQLFKFDRSLMERLVDNGFQMSQINVQRRMRPTISHFIRTILYPKLEDNALVYQYPAVQGMQKDVFFYNHLNKEGGSDDSVSKYNTFEVEMIRDLVIYFLRQGMYSEPGDIAVLCAYLGQLTKVRAALRDMKIAVAVDERDAEELARQGLEEQIDFEEVLVAKHVRLGTVDIFQGQEAKIVIVSLVRNSGQCDTGSASIGFLKSSNRINVALSRAKHGLFILGNAANLRKNGTWSTILDEMEDRGQMGTGFPIICPRHPDQTSFITKPGELSIVAPAGGCLLPCGFRMSCGHICPSACHSAPDNHRSIRCEFPMYKVVLPCGHTAAKVYCSSSSLQSNAPSRFGNHSPAASIQRLCLVIAIPPLCPAGNLAQVLWSVAASPAKPRAESAKRSTSKPNGAKEARSCGRTMSPIPASGRCTVSTTAASRARRTTNATRSVRRLAVSNAYTTAVRSRAPSLARRAWSPAFGLVRTFHALFSAVRSARAYRVTSLVPRSYVVVIRVHPNKKADIVDFIMQRRLEEIDLESSDVSDRLIALACGHIFTVETLDGHCSMSEYYEVDPMGRFLSTKSPPVNYQSPPMCPTCRGPINSLRYGRVTKRATLDILEQNVASTMSGDLDACSPAVSKFSSSLSALEDRARKLPIGTKNEDSDAEDAPPPWVQDHGPLPATALNLNAMQTVHGLPLEEARAWNQIVQNIIGTYRRVITIATTRGAHVKAYESALTTLYRLEMQQITSDPARATDAPEPLALKIVDHKIGQPPPKADVRFQIEAYFLSLEIRSLIAQVARARVEALSKTSTEASTIDHQALWTTFVDFLYSSCITDAKKARDLADNSSATRQAARASLLVIRYEFEVFRWRMQCKRTDLFREGALDENARNELSREVKAHKSSMSRSLDTVQKDYMRKRPSKTMEDLKAERKWLEEHCCRKVEAWQVECDALEEFLVKGGFYQPLSLQERADIVKAFGFSHRGHFYNCENGHTFVITECGGAMEASKCPECNAPIGGAHHQLVSSNTRAIEFENIARQEGSLDAPWPWARGA